MPIVITRVSKNSIVHQCHFTVGCHIDCRIVKGYYADSCSPKSSVYTNSGASDFCHIQTILPDCLSDFARFSDQFWDRNFPISPSDFVQRDVCQSDALKNRTDGLAKLVGQPKLDWFWLLHVNNPKKFTWRHFEVEWFRCPFSKWCKRHDLEMRTIISWIIFDNLFFLDAFWFFDRRTERKTERQAGRQKHRQTDTQKHIQT